MEIQLLSEVVDRDLQHEGLVLHGSPYVVDEGVYQVLVTVEHKIISMDTVGSLVKLLESWEKRGWRASGGITCDSSLYHLVLVKES